MATPEPTAVLDEALIEEIVRRVRSVARPQKIILFGSAAAGKMTRDSDIDLLIVEAEPFNRRDEYLRIRSALRGMGFPFDILFISTEWFEASKDVVGGVAHPANKYGRLIYEAH